VKATGEAVASRLTQQHEPSAGRVSQWEEDVLDIVYI
jgi:hypothetical protein